MKERGGERKRERGVGMTERMKQVVRETKRERERERNSEGGGGERGSIQ